MGNWYSRTWLKMESAPPGQHLWAPCASFQDAPVQDQAAPSKAAGTRFVSHTTQLWNCLLVCLRKEPPGTLLSVLRGMKCCFRSSTIFVEFDLHFFHSFTFFTCFQNGVICDFLLCRPYNPLQRQTTRTSLIPSILMHSLFFQLPLSSVSHLTTHPVRSQKLWRLRQH